jgi:hypothetical protein
MNYLLLKKYIILFFLLSFFNSYGQEQNLDNLKIEIIKVSDVLTLPGSGGFLTHPYYGIFVLIKLKIENTSNENIYLDFDKFYIVDDIGDGYPFSSFYGFASTKKKLKPGKSIKRILYFDFPLDVEPKILLIHDRKVSLE